jgi:hypothetical protein
MSYDVIVNYTATTAPSSTDVVTMLRSLGVECTMADDVGFEGDGGWLPFTLSVSDDADLVDAARMSELGEIETGVELFGDAGRTTLSCKSSEGNIPALLHACAIAAHTGGSVDDPQTGVTVDGAELDVRDVLEQFFEQTPEGWLYWPER